MEVENEKQKMTSMKTKGKGQEMDMQVSGNFCRRISYLRFGRIGNNFPAVVCFKSRIYRNFMHITSNINPFMLVHFLPLQSHRHGIFPPIGGFPPIERSHRSFFRSVQIR